MQVRRNINYENIELIIIASGVIYMCKQCAKFQSANPISARNHLSHAHKRCPVGRAISPYPPATFGRMDELKRHFVKNKCPEVGDKNGQEIWNDINQTNNEFNAQ